MVRSSKYEECLFIILAMALAHENVLKPWTRTLLWSTASFKKHKMVGLYKTGFIIILTSNKVYVAVIYY
jgi:hypothetical protein